MSESCMWILISDKFGNNDSVRGRFRNICFSISFFLSFFLLLKYILCFFFSCFFLYFHPGVPRSDITTKDTSTPPPFPRGRHTHFLGSSALNVHRNMQ